MLVPIWCIRAEIEEQIQNYLKKKIRTKTVRLRVFHFIENLPEAMAL